MIKKIANRLKMFSLIPSVYAAGETIQIAPTDTVWDKIVKNLTVGSIIGGLINLVLIVASLIFFFILVIGGIKWIVSNGDEKSVESARSQITNALIGLAIVFAAWAILKLIGILFGLDLTSGFTVPTFTK
ncbi:MAG: hypothetical protein Q8P53_02900 [Candidatus Shapirobacteria bacterium]|nr:hypothetical protein [Candidatus Shapirobacteria bacterium]